MPFYSLELQDRFVMVSKALKTVVHLICTCGGIGHIGKAPGTFGSIPGLALGYLLHVSLLSQTSDLVSKIVLYLVTSALLYFVAWLAIRWDEKWRHEHDSSHTVVDEVVGMAIGVMWIDPHLYIYALSFVVFRILDIRKPGLIGWADRDLKGAHGTLLDDVIAGLITAAVSALLQAVIVAGWHR